MTTVMTLMKNGIGTIVRTVALCCAALYIFIAPATQQVAKAQQMELERVGTGIWPKMLFTRIENNSSKPW